MQTTLTSKGQVVIPRAVRKQMLLDQGSKFAVSVQDGAIVLRPVGVPVGGKTAWQPRNPKERHVTTTALCAPVSLTKE